MWALWVVLVSSVVMAGPAVITARRQAVARALIGDLEAALDRFGVGHSDDRYSWVPVLVTRNVPWQSSNEMVAVARQHEGAVEVRHELGHHQQHSRLPVEGWYRRSASPFEVVMHYRRPRSKQMPGGPLVMMMLLRPEQVKMFPNVSKRRSPWGERSSEVEVRRMLVGVGLASWFGVTVSPGDTCVPAIERGIDGPEAARLVVGQGDAFNVWGPGARFCGSISLARSSFRRRIGHVRLHTASPVPADGDRLGTEMVLKLRLEHAMAIRNTDPSQL